MGSLLNLITKTLSNNLNIKKLSQKQQDRVLGYFLLLPITIIVIGFVGYPFITAILMSFQKKYVGVPGEFIGLKNYITLFNNPTFWIVVKNTFIYSLTAVFLKITLGMLIAKFLNQKFRGNNIVGGIFLISWVMPIAISALAWKWIFQDIGGVLNWILENLGFIDRAIPFLSIPKIALGIVIFVNVWRGLPFFALSFQAALKNVPEDQCDAAKVAGASKIQIFRYVELPNILSVVLIVLTLTTVWTFADFQVVWILTKGGPGNLTQVFATYTYGVAIITGNLGLGVTVSLIMFPFLATLIFFITNFMSKIRQ
jgi:multiple sugar transport system permease protein